MEKVTLLNFYIRMENFTEDIDWEFHLIFEEEEVTILGLTYTKKDIAFTALGLDLFFKR